MRTSVVMFLTLTLLIAVIYEAVASETTPIRIYVATDGDDRYDGSTALPESQGRGPVKTLERARVLARILHRRNSIGLNPIEVLIAPGTYTLNETFTLETGDSGSPAAPVIYRGAHDGGVYITGGVQITGWRLDPIWGFSAPLDSKSFGRSCPSQLFINGERRMRPRLPARGTFAIFGVDPSSTNTQPRVDHFFANPGDLPKDFRPAQDTEIVILDAWTASILRVEKYDAISGRLDLNGTFAGHGQIRSFTAGLPYYFENQPVSHLEPGTWRCDPAKGEFEYSPLPGEKIGELMAVAPRLTQIVAIRGRPEMPVHDVAFEDIAFENAAWNLPPGGWAAMQAEVGIGAAIEMQGCASIFFRHVTVAHSGAEGIGIRRDCVNVGVRDGRLDDLGGGGIAIGSAQRYPAPGSDWEGGESAKGETHDVDIVGNDIGRLGRIQSGAPGIWSGQAHHVRIEKNYIHDLFYSGISIGWVWNFGPSLSHDNVVSQNVIENFGQGFLSDFGGIYTLGRQENTLVSDNTISEGIARNYGGHGLYADEASAGITFARNHIAKTSHAAIHVHFGTELTFSENTAETYGEAGIRCSGPSQGQSVLFERNIFLGSSTPETFGKCTDGSYSFKNNVFIRGDARETLNKPFGQTSFSIQK